MANNPADTPGSLIVQADDPRLTATDTDYTAYKNDDGTYTLVPPPANQTDTGSSSPTVGTVPSGSVPVSNSVVANAPNPTQTPDTGASSATVSTAAQPKSVTPQYTNSPIPLTYQPDAFVYVNGAPLGRPIKFEVSLNNNYQADKYYLEMDLPSMPSGYQEAFWSDGDQKKIEIHGGYLNQPLVTFIIGMIDESDIDWDTRTLTMHGRDLSGQLMDNKSSEKYANQTSSQIASAIAAQYGLTADIDTTTTLVGSYYQREHAKLTSEVTQHDLLTYLADEEGFSYWVKLNTLHFKAAAPPSANTFAIAYQPATPQSIAVGNFISLKTHRSETLAKDIVVKVISWNAKQKMAITSTVKRTRTKATGAVTKQTSDSSTTTEQFVFRVAGLSQKQADTYAANKAKEISSHERVIEAEMPIDFALNPRTQVSLRGTNTAFDQSYYVDSIELEGSFDDGFRMIIHAKNHSPQTQTTV